ncbi:hypothetical protein [Sphingosinicella sp. CPCC 101087]|uniref:hypothetical protein n=1 Tax=Sphingosinicella sp. CPCC 101087 TaxID=2497754 RepID=UPI00101DEAB8|nr:hypothetical protein [Sphingosinicella sp. CPCC 101087]
MSGTNADGAIVVEGHRDLDRRVQRVIDVFAQSGPDEQLSRFEAPVCPAAAGLGEASNRAIADRMRRVASAAGIAVAPVGCAPNIVVLAAPGKADAIRALHERDPEMFTGLRASDLAQLAASPGPTVSWQVRKLVGSDGQQVTHDIEGQSWVVGLQTRTTSPTRPIFLAAFLVIETAALNGLTPIQIADYATLRTFIATDPSRARLLRSPTILNLFDERGRRAATAPPSLTEWDLRLLRVYYSTSNRYHANIQRSAMQRAFLDDMAGSTQPKP